MNLSTSTNLVYLRPNKDIVPLEKVFKICKKAGFERFDFNSYDWSRANLPFTDDEKWEKWIDNVVEEKEKCNITFYQSHGYTFLFTNYSPDSIEYKMHQKLVERSIKCCAKLGVEVIVLHPATNFDGDYNTSKSKVANIKYFNDLYEVCSKYNIKIAIENMVDNFVNFKRRYCSTTEELIDLVDSIDNSNIGICWDFEHGEIMNLNQVQALKDIGSRLFATHVSDTHSKTDTELMHVLPFLAGIEWEPIVKQLKKMNYNGEFSFEVHKFTHNVPDELLQHAVNYAYKVGEYLVNL